MSDRSRVVLLAAILVACSGRGGQPVTDTFGPGAEAPDVAVEQLFQHLTAGDFIAAGSLTVPGQATMASLGEGATVSQVAAAIERGDPGVAVNFWTGFAQGVGSLLRADLSVRSLGVETVDGIEFHILEVTPNGGSSRRMVVRDIDGYRVDVFASFGATLSERMLDPVERLLATTRPEAATVLLRLREVVPSLKLASTERGLAADAVQDVLRLIELITRVG